MLSWSNTMFDGNICKFSIHDDVKMKDVGIYGGGGWYLALRIEKGLTVG